MDANRAHRFSCVVCGVETKRHSGWFLVVENRWLDRLTVLSWHPLVARQAKMQSVCSKQHLKTLLTHWLTHANLQFLATGSSHWAVPGDTGSSESDSVTVAVSKLVGELTVHRESLSRVWTGSPETLECILNALIGGLETRSRAPEFPPLDPATEYSRECAPH
ncbi:MAG: hypothetical protein HY233_07825 [Acidobacteriales bacterium]|nr:hypothetical protein [Candidatus Koribacter versatilis]MBI3645856.1 hypothetical protein [Terriglobales bacterium]